MKLKSKWTYTFAKGLKGPMISNDYYLDRNNLYFALSLGIRSMNSVLLKLNLDNLDCKTLLEENHILRTAGIHENGRIYLTSMKGMAYCIDYEGNKIWETSIGDKNASFKIAMDDNHFYASNHSMYCLDKTTGKIIWMNDEFNHKINCNIVYDENYIYCGESGGYIFCLNKFTGETVWFTGKYEWITNIEMLDENRLFINHNRRFYVLDAKTGNMIKKQKANGYLYNSPVFEGSRIYIGDENDVSEATAGNMTCYELNSKNELKEEYKLTVSGAVTSKALISGNRLFFGTEKGYVYCIDKEDGKELMRPKKVKGSCRNIVLRENELIVLSDKGQVECFEIIS